MTKPLIKLIADRYELITRTVKALEERLKSFPDGRLVVEKHKGGTHFILVVKGQNKRYLSKNDSRLIEQLIQKDYYSKALRKGRKEIQVLRRTLRSYPDTVVEDVFDSLSEGRKEYAKPIILDDEQYAARWLAEPYKPKPFKKGAPVFYTLKGERVRSKSEVIIADRLFNKGIPYKYECPLKVGNEVIHPDFTILRMSDRQIVYHEHCGKMSDPDYAQEIPDRNNKYAQRKIYQGDKLFYSFESAEYPLNVKLLNDFIENNYR